MKLTAKRIFPVVLLLCGLALSFQSQAVPDYVTAWPKQVPIEKPDPVLGDKLYWEHWVYSESFAKRFKGFIVESADPELKDSQLHAIVLRIFKRNLWAGVNDSYPKQYACEIEIYFDSSLSIPLSAKIKDPAKRYPTVAAPGYSRLDPYNEEDRLAIAQSQSVTTYPQRSPVVFSVPLDGRFTTFGLREYRHNLAPFISVAVLSQAAAHGGCEVTAPLQRGGAHWLSLTGERPWDMMEGGSPKAVHGLYGLRDAVTFAPGSDPESKGYVRIPEAFYKAALPKAALIKVLNWCIRQRHSPSNWKVNGRNVTFEEMTHRCEEVEQNGSILPDPRYHPGKEGLQDTGY